MTGTGAALTLVPAVVAGPLAPLGLDLRHHEARLRLASWSSAATASPPSSRRWTSSRCPSPARRTRSSRDRHNIDARHRRLRGPAHRRRASPLLATRRQAAGERDQRRSRDDRARRADPQRDAPRPAGDGQRSQHALPEPHHCSSTPAAATSRARSGPSRSTARKAQFRVPSVAAEQRNMDDGRRRRLAAAINALDNRYLATKIAGAPTVAIVDRAVCRRAACRRRSVHVRDRARRRRRHGRVRHRPRKPGLR